MSLFIYPMKVARLLNHLPYLSAGGFAKAYVQIGQLIWELKHYVWIIYYPGHSLTNTHIHIYTRDEQGSSTLEGSKGCFDS